MSNDIEPPGGRSDHTSRLRNRSNAFGAALLLVALAVLVAVLRFDGGIPADVANGSYANDCCGTIMLRDGRLSMGTEKSVGYVVGQDDAGPYILPNTYIGPWEERGFEIDGSRPPIKLRLDAIPNPTTVTLHGVGKSYSFRRKTFRMRPPAKRPDRNSPRFEGSAEEEASDPPSIRHQS